MIGQSVERIDAGIKADGTVQYTDDLEFDGLHAKVIRSEIAHGEILAIEYSETFDFSDFVIVDYQDIEGRNVNPLIIEDQPFLAEKVVRFIGEPILLLAHRSKTALKAAQKAITIRYKSYPAVFDMQTAQQAETVIFSDDNIYKTINTQVGVRPDTTALNTLEKLYTTPHQEQLYLEPQSMLARYSSTKIKIIGSMQCPFYVESALQSLSDDRIEIEQAPTGGAFGGKEEYPSLMAAYVYLLSKKAKKDVKLIYSRSEDIAYSTKRHPSQMRYRSYFDERGKLHGLEIDFMLDGGAYCTLTPVVQARMQLHCAGFYDCPYIKVDSASYATNTPPNGAFRGFGAPQAIFGIERHMDDIARSLELSPVDVREVNLPTADSLSVSGAKIAEYQRIRALFKKTREESRIDEKLAHKKEHSGIGMALFMHGGGFTGIGETLLNSKVWIDLHNNGIVEIKIANVEMGQGALTVLPQIVADRLNIPLKFIKYHVPNTAEVANSGPTVASRTVMIIGKLLAQLSTEIKTALPEYSGTKSYLQSVSKYLQERQNRRFENIYVKPDTVKWDEENFYGNGYDGYSLACHVAEIDIDPVTYQTKVSAFYAYSDVGTVINPVLAEGQVEGGVAQGIGYALFEHIVHVDGKVRNSHLSDYIVPLSSDLPRLKICFLNTEDEAKGLGELPMNGPAPAVANALSNAMNTAFDTIPITPEVVEQRWK